jgi:hypothetical protein
MTDEFRRVADERTPDNTARVALIVHLRSYHHSPVDLRIAMPKPFNLNCKRDLAAL